jgi:hypothetical protein
MSNRGDYLSRRYGVRQKIYCSSSRAQPKLHIMERQNLPIDEVNDRLYAQRGRADSVASIRLGLRLISHSCRDVIIA